MDKLRLLPYAAILGALCLATCEKGCQKPAPKPQEEKPLEHKKATPDQITSFSELDISSLNDNHKKSLIKLFNDEICPCGCPKTFAQCLNAPGCGPGVKLAEWTMHQLKEGAPEHYLFKAVSEEINSGYLAEPKSISLLGAYHKGNIKAPITIVEFADFECPACKMASAQMREFVKGRDDVVIYFMHFPLSVHPHAEAAAVAAEAAGVQGKFWEMHDLLFGHEGALSTETIDSLAKQIFKDAKKYARFKKDLSDPKLLEKVRSHRKYGLEELKLMSTPTFLWNGRPYNLSSSQDGYKLRLDMEKMRDSIKCP